MNENTSKQTNLNSSETQTENTGAFFNATLDDATASGAKQDDSNNWMLTDEVKGSGDKPEWFINDKYKTVSEQAKAYKEAQKMIGNRPTAPDQYKLNLTEENKDSNFNQEEGFLKTFTEIAKESGMTQEKYDESVNKYAAFQKEQTTNFMQKFEEDSKKIFKDAGLDEVEIKSKVQNWLLSSLGEDQKEFVEDLIVDPYTVRALGMVIEKKGSNGVPAPKFSSQIKDKEYFLNKMRDKRYAYDMNYSKSVDDEMAEAIIGGTYNK